MVTQLLNYKWQSASVSVIFIVLISALFTSLFSSPIVAAKNILPGCHGENFKLKGANQRLDDSTINLIKSEHANAVDEIKERSKVNDAWFHNKFVLVGGLLAALLIHLKWIGNGNTSEYAVNDLQRFFKKTIIPAFVLGMACVVSLAIDIHIGNNQMIVQQLAHLIRNCVEPFLNKNSAYYVDWESFIRIQSINATGKIVATGMHVDTVFNRFNASHFYLGSILLYIYNLFICLFWGIEAAERIHGLVFIFFLVHLTLVMCGVGSNSFPSTFTVQLAVWPRLNLSGKLQELFLF